MSMTLPRSGSKGKKKLAPDSLSLVNEPGTLTQGALTRNNPLSSSMTDLNQTGKYCHPSRLTCSSVNLRDYCSCSKLVKC